MIIAIANSKGGVGKSTVAVHLAGWLHEQGHQVILADCDSQQSSSEWIREAVPQVKSVRLDNPDVILSELPNLAQEADFVVADGPGSQTETSRALLLRANLAIVPCKASMLEVRGAGESHRSAATSSRYSQRAAQGGDRAEHGRQALPVDKGHEGRGTSSIAPGCRMTIPAANGPALRDAAPRRAYFRNRFNSTAWKPWSRAIRRKVGQTTRLTSR